MDREKTAKQNSLKIADILRDHPWFPCEMTSEERQQKFHTDTSSVWNFCARFLVMISRETSGGLEKCWLFSQTTKQSFRSKLQLPLTLKR